MTLTQATAIFDSLDESFLSMVQLYSEPLGDGITEYVVTCHPTSTPTATRGMNTGLITYYLWNRVKPFFADGSQVEELELCGVTFSSLNDAKAAIENRRARYNAAAVDHVADRIEDMRHRNYESGDPYGEDEW